MDTTPKRPRRRLTSANLATAGILWVALVVGAIVCFLPDQPYERFQLLDGTLYKNVRWIYERIHYDPRPIDVAIIGSSKSLLGLSASRMEQRLAQLGKPAAVANLSVVASGRNIEWVVANELYKKKNPKVLLVLIDETPFKYGHMGFRYVAAARDVVFPPAPFLHNYLYDLFYLPYRQLELLAASLFPDAFHMSRTFDPALYAATRSDFTTSFRGQDGNWVDMDHEIPAAALVSDRRRYLAHEKRSLIPSPLAPLVEADDRVYVEQIVRQAAAHGTKLVFVFIPIFDGVLDPKTRAFYARFGAIEDYGDMARENRLYSLWAHLNHNGAMILSDRVATAVAPDI